MVQREFSGHPPKIRHGSLPFVIADTLLWPLAVFAAVALRFDFRIDVSRLEFYMYLALGSATLSLVVGFATHLYRNRFIIGSLDELLALTLTVSSVGLLVGGGILLMGHLIQAPRSVALIAALIFLLLSGGLRLVIRWSRVMSSGKDPGLRRALVYGAGKSAEALIGQLQAAEKSTFKVVGTLDDDESKRNRWIRGVPNLGKWDSLRDLVSDHGVSVLIVCIPDADSTLMTKVHQEAQINGLDVFVVPQLEKQQLERTEFPSLRALSIEDLVGRKAVQLDTSGISDFIRGKSVMVTGAGGSIGSELAQQILRFTPGNLVLVDRDETLLQATEFAIRERWGESVCSSYLLDVRDDEAIRQSFDRHRPEVVFHAAALKHVAILEQFPGEAWKTNVVGTLNVLRHASEFGCAVFVNVSTDKAADAISVLGRSKKLAEELTSWFAQENGQRFISVRFGNVLGSRGSLVPILTDRILRGLPLHLTHQEATRYFMSIPEACQLVLQAASEGQGGDVLLLEMGSSIRISEIAERLMEIYGKTVPVVYTGLRPGEKVHEKLIGEGETKVSSLSSSVFRVKSVVSSPSEVLAQKW